MLIIFQGSHLRRSKYRSSAESAHATTAYFRGLTLYNKSRPCISKLSRLNGPLTMGMVQNPSQKPSSCAKHGTDS